MQYLEETLSHRAPSRARRSRHELAERVALQFGRACACRGISVRVGILPPLQRLETASRPCGGSSSLAPVLVKVMARSSTPARSPQAEGDDLVIGHRRFCPRSACTSATSPFPTTHATASAGGLVGQGRDRGTFSLMLLCALQVLLLAGCASGDSGHSVGIYRHRRGGLGGQDLHDAPEDPRAARLMKTGARVQSCFSAAR